jgi:cytoskeletal protein CcmA (bactofilin family)
MPDLNSKPDDFATVIGADAQFKGELSFQGGVRLDGHFEGAIQTAGRVLVSKSGKLKAEVKAGTVVLEGQCDGNVAAEDRVEIRATAQLRGDVRATKLLVAEGASWVGRCEVGPNVAAGAPAPKSADAGMRAIPSPVRH